MRSMAPLNPRFKPKKSKNVAISMAMEKTLVKNVDMIVRLLDERITHNCISNSENRKSFGILLLLSCLAPS